MFEHDGTQYRFEFSEGVIEAIETALGHSIMSALYTNAGMIPLRDAKLMFTMGLETASDSKRVAQNTAIKIWDDVKGQLGYAEIVGMLIQAFEHDCPFFFQTN